MKKLLFIISFILTSCSSIKFVTVDHGRLITQDKQPINILGNPLMVCHYENSPQTFSGYFIYLKEDGTIVLDDFGRGTIQLMDSPICRLGYGD